MKSLYESFNLPDPAVPDAEQLDPLLALNGKEFSKAVLTSVEFRYYIVRGLAMRDLPPAILCRLIDHGWGKPPERIEVKDTTISVESLTPEHLEDRAQRLAEMARLMRRAEEFDEPLTLDSVH